MSASMILELRMQLSLAVPWQGSASLRGREVKLTDFGLALAKDGVMAMTAPGMVKGKLACLAPESLLGTTGNPRTDIFAVGTVLWESLSGKKLFSGDDDDDDDDDDDEVYKKLLQTYA